MTNTKLTDFECDTLTVAGQDVTAAIGEVAAINGLTASAAELNLNDGAAAGVVTDGITLVAGDDAAAFVADTSVTGTASTVTGAVSGAMTAVAATGGEDITEADFNPLVTDVAAIKADVGDLYTTVTALAADSADIYTTLAAQNTLILAMKAILVAHGFMEAA